MRFVIYNATIIFGLSGPQEIQASDESLLATHKNVCCVHIHFEKFLLIPWSVCMLGMILGAMLVSLVMLDWVLGSKQKWSKIVIGTSMRRSSGRRSGGRLLAMT